MDHWQRYGILQTLHSGISQGKSKTLDRHSKKSRWHEMKGNHGKWIESWPSHQSFDSILCSHVAWQNTKVSLGIGFIFVNRRVLELCKPSCLPSPTATATPTTTTTTTTTTSLTYSFLQAWRQVSSSSSFLFTSTTQEASLQSMPFLSLH